MVEVTVGPYGGEGRLRKSGDLVFTGSNGLTTTARVVDRVWWVLVW